MLSGYIFNTSTVIINIGLNMKKIEPSLTNHSDVVGYLLFLVDLC